MKDLKEYQRHIADTHEERKGLSICGERIFGWHYMDVDHAFMSAPRDYMQPCPACAAKVVAVFSACE